MWTSTSIETKREPYATTFDYVLKRFLGRGLQQSAMRGIFGGRTQKDNNKNKITSGEGAALLEATLRPLVL